MNTLVRSILALGIAILLLMPPRTSDAQIGGFSAGYFWCSRNYIVVQPPTPSLAVSAPDTPGTSPVFEIIYYGADDGSNNWQFQINPPRADVNLTFPWNSVSTTHLNGKTEPHVIEVPPLKRVGVYHMILGHDGKWNIFWADAMDEYGLITGKSCASWRSI